MNKKMALVIMAAGLGSRFGGGIKQLESVGPNGEIIMDYSIHDAIEAGFNKIVFIIRKDIEQDFRVKIGARIEVLCEKLNVEVQYAYQELSDLPEGFSLPTERTKPWGTGHAVLCAKDQIKEPFVVINADDYYGKEAYKMVHDFLLNYTAERPTEFCMAGFVLANTLSDNGGVTRGVCQVGEDGYLQNVTETYRIQKTTDGAESNGVAVDVNSTVSMNMWGLTPEFIGILEDGFNSFLNNLEGNELKGEYLLPTYIGQLLQEQKVSVKVLRSEDRWFGLTYKEDAASVKDSFCQLIADGVYSEQLFSDLK